MTSCPRPRSPTAVVEAGAQPYQIALSPESREILRTASYVSRDGLEWACYLYCPRGSGWERHIEIRNVVAARGEVERGRDSMSAESYPTPELSPGLVERVTAALRGR